MNIKNKLNKNNITQKIIIKNIDGEEVISNYFEDEYCQGLDETLKSELKPELKGEIYIGNQFTLEEIVLSDKLKENILDFLVHTPGKESVSGIFNIQKYSPQSFEKIFEFLSKKENLTFDKFFENADHIEKLFHEIIREFELRNNNAGYLWKK